MATAESAARGQGAESILMPPGRALIIDDAPQIFVIQSGRVEIYGLIAQQRRFLAELSAGQLIFGGGAQGLAAIAPDGGALVRLSWDDVWRGSDCGPVLDQIGNHLSHWIALLAHGLARLLPERPVMRGVGAGDRLRSGSAPTQVTATNGVLWIYPRSGSDLRLLGLAPAPADRPVPVTPAIWWSLRGEASIKSGLVPTGERDCIDALAAFHSVLTAAIALCEERRQVEKNRQNEQSEQIADDAMAQVRENFARVFAERGDLPTRAPAGLFDLHFVLEKLAGQSIGFKAAAPTLAVGQFSAYAELYEFRCRDVILHPHWWRQDRGPLAGKMSDDGSILALVPDGLGRYRVHRPGHVCQLVTEENARQISPRAVQLIRSLPTRPLRAWDLLILSLGQGRLDLTNMVIAILAMSLMALALPGATAAVMDTFIPDQLKSGMILVGVTLCGLAIVSTLLQVASDISVLRMDSRLSALIQIGLIDRVLRLPARIARVLSSGDLALQVMSLEQARRTLVNVGLTTILRGVFGFLGFVLLFYYSPLVAVIAVAIFVVLMIGAFWAGRGQLKQLALGEALAANVNTLTLQMIQNVSLLRAFGAKRQAFALWARNAANLRGRSLRARRVSMIFGALVSSYDLIALAAIFAALGYGSENPLSIGAYLAFISVYMGFLGVSETLGRMVVQIMGLKPTLDRAATLLRAQPEITSHGKDPGALSGAVEVSNLTFSYAPDLPLVLRGLSLRILPGQFIAVVGPSGTGKTTLINLILGFDQPNDGMILFDGKNMAGLNKSAVRRQIGIVRQGGRLLAGSLHENILGLQAGGVEEAWEAAELAGIAGDIRALPMGMHTVLNEGASTFSAGQVQRLLLARALAGNPRLLILDEATSALDNVTQSIVTDNIARLGISRLVIAHRLSTIRTADRILFLREGRIAESGTFDELARPGTFFSEFVRRQTV